MDRILYNRIGDLIDAVDNDHTGSLDRMVESIIMLAKATDTEDIDDYAKGALQALEAFTDRKFKTARDSIFSGSHRHITQRRIEAKGGQ
jgi:hypothetical protein